ncbi:MAG: phosphatidylglycerol lysyltransferase domain-containing protein [Eubacteriales bacterium]
MLPLKELQLSDLSVIKPYLVGRSYRLCDYTPGVLLMWRGRYQIEYAIEHQTLFIGLQYTKGRPAFMLPLGEDLAGGLALLTAHCKEKGISPILCNVSQEQLPRVLALYPQASAVYHRDWCDYLYDADKMVHLTGKHLAGQRNHINQFKRRYQSHTFEDITADNLDEVLIFCRAMRAGMDSEQRKRIEEMDMVIAMLAEFDRYEQVGGLLRVDGQIIGFSTGEVFDQTLFVHVEKADVRYQGAYAMVTNCFARRFVTPEVLYVNREEDMGVEGLRSSKLSYDPIALPKKYQVMIG